MLLQKRVVVDGTVDVDFNAEDVLLFLKQADSLAKEAIVNGALLALTDKDFERLRAFWKDWPETWKDRPKNATPESIALDRDKQLLKIDCLDSIRRTWLRECARSEEAKHSAEPAPVCPQIGPLFPSDGMVFWERVFKDSICAAKIDGMGMATSIDLIKTYRHLTGRPLKEAKDAIDDAQEKGIFVRYQNSSFWKFGKDRTDKKTIKGPKSLLIELDGSQIFFVDKQGRPGIPARVVKGCWSAPYDFALSNAYLMRDNCDDKPLSGEESNWLLRQKVDVANFIKGYKI